MVKVDGVVQESGVLVAYDKDGNVRYGGNLDSILQKIANLIKKRILI